MDAANCILKAMICNSALLLPAGPVYLKIRGGPGLVSMDLVFELPFNTGIVS
jgi:hypothetical protein